MSNSLKRVISAVVLSFMIVFAFYIGTAVVSTQAVENVSWPATEVTQQQIPTNATEAEQVLATLYNNAAPSVVSINVVARQSGTGFYNQQDQLVQGTGTGFVIDTEGHIVTNNHVVEGATRIEVNFFDGRIVRGEVVGTDPDSDLAVIQVNDVPAEDLRPIALGDSDGLFIGQEVVAIGSPFGERWTMTSGIISALDRTIQGLTDFSIGSVIQTDAAINPGNSGGPLLNLQGQVIGVNSQIESQSRSSSGIGFAIPSNLVQRVAQALIESGNVDYSYLGIQGGPIDLYTIEALNLPNDAQGVVVGRVVAGGPAADAGLRQASSPRNVDGIPVATSVDIITAIDGQPVRDMADLISYLAENTTPGQTVQLTVVRDGDQQLELPVTLSERPNGGS
jgi:S1-C subfamily serine protease